MPARPLTSSKNNHQAVSVEVGSDAKEARRSFVRNASWLGRAHHLDVLDDKRTIKNGRSDDLPGRYGKFTKLTSTIKKRSGGLLHHEKAVIAGENQ